ncbi:hypothetical protein [Rhodovulum sulfidophilum]|uniref:Uncharacterized protein n=1 Tax=Rhodovulum sulfidophilum TaxID=35806 RepID=A0ABS1RUF3_RHOSU|nr:hypothetical protein [Rhodovulum sulfidophilum]MBL3609721.1 hypothetical protein [Rhodovulum sulfidophilum]MCE8457706.1 hypothetical protein [Rhodovulum sulfidophilum]
MAITESADHVDRYDKIEMIAFKKLERVSRQNLAGGAGRAAVCTARPSYRPLQPCRFFGARAQL